MRSTSPSNVIRAVESFFDDLSNWYIRRSRRRFYTYDEAAFRTLWVALVQGIRVIAPVMPFLAEHLWQALVRGLCEQAPDSIFLAGWPERQEDLLDEHLLAQMATVRQVVQLGRRARGDAGVKLRQPLRQVYIRGAPLAGEHVAEISEELRVKHVGFDQGPRAHARLLPNLPALGPRLGAKLRDVRAALVRGEVEQLDGGRLAVVGEVLEADEVIRGERIALDGWAIAEEDGVSIAFDLDLDDELRREGRVYDLIHALNVKRRDEGLNLSDRISVRLPGRDADLLEHEDWIKHEVLATAIEVNGEVQEPTISVSSRPRDLRVVQAETQRREH